MNKTPTKDLNKIFKCEQSCSPSQSSLNEDNLDEDRTVELLKQVADQHVRIEKLEKTVYDLRAFVQQLKAVVQLNQEADRILGGNGYILEGDVVPQSCATQTTTVIMPDGVVGQSASGTDPANIPVDGAPGEDRVIDPHTDRHSDESNDDSDVDVGDFVLSKRQQAKLTRAQRKKERKRRKPVPGNSNATGGLLAATNVTNDTTAIDRRATVTSRDVRSVI